MQESLRIQGDYLARIRRRPQDVHARWSPCSPPTVSFRILTAVCTLTVLLATDGSKWNGAPPPLSLADARGNDSITGRNRSIRRVNLRVARRLVDDVGLPTALGASDYPSDSPSLAPSVALVSDLASPDPAGMVPEPTFEPVVTILEPTQGEDRPEPALTVPPSFEQTSEPTDAEEWTRQPSANREILSLEEAPADAPAAFISSDSPSESPSEAPVTPEPSIITLEPTEAETPSPTPGPSEEIPTADDDDGGLEPLTLEPNGEGDDDVFTPVSLLTVAPTSELDGRQLESDSPSSSPSERPSPSPFAPTDQPVLSPVAPPPTPPPASPPTPPPASSPTPPPASSPTPPPASPPTPPPAPPPTLQPTTPAPLPTVPATGTPTPRPSTAPPVDSPVASPVASPTPPPTPRPTTRAPTIAPTRRLTPVPSAQPSLTVSQDPTPSGTLEPTLFPSGQPTGTPTDTVPALPSASPSAAPSLSLQTQLVESQMGMFPFLGGGRLQGRDPIIWESVTGEFLTDFITSVTLDPPLFDLDVKTNINEQIPARTQTTEAGTSTRRYLQESDAEIPSDALTIVFDVEIRFRSESSDVDAKQLVFNAWQSSISRAQYVINLQDESATFDPVQDVEVIVEGYVPPPPTPAPTPDENNANIAVIAGASVGGAALVILLALIFMKRRNAKQGLETENEESRATPSTGQNNKVSTEILVEPQDDVSTLGDPMFGQGGMMMGDMDKDEFTASVGDDYDYTKQYRQARDPLSIGGASNSRDRIHSEDFTKVSSANSAAMSKLGRMGDNLFADDASFEQQFADPEERFDVVAPAGKLGMVIDTPNGGVPVVHAIKDTSVLAEEVRVGDRLLSVDGEDCTGMTAMQVSKLISLKSEKPARVLVFARSAANTTNTR